MCTADTDFAQLSSIESAIYCPIMMIVKVSILLQYIALFVIHRGTAFHYTVQVLVWINVLYYTIATVVFVTEVSNYNLPRLMMCLEKTKGC